MWTLLTPHKMIAWIEILYPSYRHERECGCIGTDRAQNRDSPGSHSYNPIFETHQAYENKF